VRELDCQPAGQPDGRLPERAAVVDECDERQLRLEQRRGERRQAIERGLGSRVEQSRRPDRGETGGVVDVQVDRHVMIPGGQRRDALDLLDDLEEVIRS
jgi:hypothetical protein